MARHSIHFEGSLRLAKLYAGPIVSPMPGPTFATAVAAALKLVTKSLPEAASKIAITATVPAKARENAITDATMSSDNCLPCSDLEKIALGCSKR